MNLPPAASDRVGRLGAAGWPGPVLVALGGLVATGLLVHTLVRLDREQAARTLQQVVHGCCKQVEARLDALVARLSLAEYLLVHRGPPDERAWQAWFDARVRDAFPEVLALAYCPQSMLPEAADLDDRRPIPLVSYATRDPVADDPGGMARTIEIHKGDPGDLIATLEEARSLGSPRLSAFLDAGLKPGMLWMLLPVPADGTHLPDSGNLAGMLMAMLDPRVLEGGMSPAVQRRWRVQRSDNTWQGPPDSWRQAQVPGRVAITETTRSWWLGRQFEYAFWLPAASFRDRVQSRAGAAALFGVAGTGFLTGLVWIQSRTRRDQVSTALQLRAANERLATVTRERERLSRDLHDGTIQSIYAMGFDLQRVRAILEDDPSEARDEITRILSGLNEVVTELREFILQAEPAGAEPQRVDAVLRSLVGRIRRNTKAEVSLDLAPEAATLVPPQQALDLLQIVREAVTNSIRHAFPRQIGIALTRDGRDWRLTIADDGAGFDSQRIPGRPGHGLHNLQERANELGGDCVIVSVPGTGTAVRVIFPVLGDPDAPGEV
ncbi:MAG: sensor histidine kinase [Verrucomicrobiae bacterium]|nr:sensor histidine kinase [Verrucomicrobiae bacterium]